MTAPLPTASHFAAPVALCPGVPARHPPGRCTRFSTSSSTSPVLIGVAVDVVVQGDQSYLARHVLGAVGITSTWHQLLVLGAVNVLVWGGESLFQYLYEPKWRQLTQDLQQRTAPGRLICACAKLDMATSRTSALAILMAVLNDDINQRSAFLIQAPTASSRCFCSSLMISAVFFGLTPGIALISLVPVPAILLGAFWFPGTAWHRATPPCARRRVT